MTYTVPNPRGAALTVRAVQSIQHENAMLYIPDDVSYQCASLVLQDDELYWYVYRQCYNNKIEFKKTLARLGVSSNRHAALNAVACMYH